MVRSSRACALRASRCRSACAAAAILLVVVVAAAAAAAIPALRHVGHAQHPRLGIPQARVSEASARAAVPGPSVAAPQVHSPG